MPIAPLCYAAVTGGVLRSGMHTRVRMPLVLRGLRTRAQRSMAPRLPGLAGMGRSFR